MIGSRIFDALERGVAWGASRQAFSAAGVIGQVRSRLSRRWPSPEQVRSLFPHLDRPAAARLAWRIGGLEARNRVLVARLRRAGLEPARSLMRRSEDFDALRPPLLLGTFHVGAVHAIGLALDRLAGPVLALRQGGPLAAPRPPVEVATTEGDAQSRAALFHRALLHLERGGFVVLALDAVSGPACRVPCLGRTIPLARGPFALARLTGAPLVPLVARWRSSRVEIILGEALAPAVPPESTSEVWEHALAAAAAGWLEHYLLEEPAETGLGLLRVLLGLDLNGS